MPALDNGHAHRISDSFHHWTNRLVQEKHTVDDEEYRRRREGWMRTLCGRPLRTLRHDCSGCQCEAVRRSNASSRPSGQIPPVAGVDKIETRLLRKGQTGEISYYTRQLKLKKRTGLKDLKMPWGLVSRRGI